jgi:hypothetical protein
MINHFNYTDRQRIPHQQLQFVWMQHNDGVLRFRAELNLTLARPLPPEAVVVVEAYSGPVVMRFPFGTVGLVQPPVDVALYDFPPGLKPSFRVKVVETSNAERRLLAWAKEITPRMPEDIEAGRRSILPVETVDLGPLVWNIRLEDNTPVLQVNSAIREPRDITTMAKEADFISLVYPAAIRQILDHLLLGPERDNVEPTHDWILFGNTLAGRIAPNPDDYDDESSEFREDVEIWIHEAVKGFCAKQATVEAYVQFRKEAEENHG